MYLKRLEIQGFKTFAPRTIFEFRPGITAIVGPNGSGKSNAADAVRWVLAILSVATLRTQVRGTWTRARVQDCLPQLVRFLVSRRRKRPLQEADIRQWLVERLQSAPPLQDAA